MPTIIFALKPWSSSTATISRHENSLGGIDSTSWPVNSVTVDDPYAIAVGRILNWDEGTFDDQGGIIVRRSGVGFAFQKAFEHYTKVTGEPAPHKYKVTRATLSFRYRSLGMTFMVGDVQHSIKRGGSQLNRLFFSSRIGPDELFEPTEPVPIKTIAPFDPRHQKIPARIETSPLDYSKIKPFYKVREGGPPPISVPIGFVTNPGGHVLSVDTKNDYDGVYVIDLTGKINPQNRFGIVFAGAPHGESLSDPDISVFDFGAALYYNFVLAVQIDF
ncbi:hypothetical protein ACN9MJ_11955 [Acidovorax facilis]|uniref:hypothetical protein n=1 Tax=Acidovorax facilis TaxID=12917 RepID=UPI003CEBA406